MRQEAPPGRGASLVKALPFRSEQLSVTPTTSRSMVARYRMECTGLEPVTPCLQSKPERQWASIVDVSRGLASRGVSGKRHLKRHSVALCEEDLAVRSGCEA